MKSLHTLWLYYRRTVRTIPYDTEDRLSFIHNVYGLRTVFAKLGVRRTWCATCEKEKTLEHMTNAVGVIRQWDGGFMFYGEAACARTSKKNGTLAHRTVTAWKLED